jgi:hypothetical protein
MNDEYLSRNQRLSATGQTETMTACFLKLRHLDFLRASSFTEI